MNNHLRQPQETQPRRYFVKNLILQGFQPHKNTIFSPFLPHFLPILEVQPPSHITKKRGNPYIYCALKSYHFPL